MKDGINSAGCDSGGHNDICIPFYHDGIYHNSACSVDYDNRNGAFDDDHDDGHNDDVEHNVHICGGGDSHCSWSGDYNGGRDIHDDHNGSHHRRHHGDDCIHDHCDIHDDHDGDDICDDW
ncbi:unnamed protein product [Trichobilharzia szidati]|nr:unnamed protein product [Trichobilharzia szidati]